MTPKLLRLLLAGTIALSVALAGCAADPDESADGDLLDDTDDTDGGPLTNDTPDDNMTSDNMTNTTDDNMTNSSG
jgi:hypothetical protein